MSRKDRNSNCLNQIKQRSKTMNCAFFILVCAISSSCCNSISSTVNYTEEFVHDQSRIRSRESSGGVVRLGGSQNILQFLGNLWQFCRLHTKAEIIQVGDVTMWLDHLALGRHLGRFPVGVAKKTRPANQASGSLVKWTNCRRRNLPILKKMTRNRVFYEFQG